MGIEYNRMGSKEVKSSAKGKCIYADVYSKD